MPDVREEDSNSGIRTKDANLQGVDMLSWDSEPEGEMDRGDNEKWKMQKFIQSVSCQVMNFDYVEWAFPFLSPISNESFKSLRHLDMHFHYAVISYVLLFLS